MHNWDYKSAKIGEFLPELKLEQISRINLAQYADASGDHNPLHIDTDYANEIGLPDVIAHGMLIMGYLGRVLTNNFSQGQIIEYSVQFCSITNGTRKDLKLELIVKNQHDDLKLKGYSLIKIL